MEGSSPDSRTHTFMHAKQNADKIIRQMPFEVLDMVVVDIMILLIRSFFCEKWLVSHVLAVLTDTKSHAGIRFVSICPLTHVIIIAWRFVLLNGENAAGVKSKAKLQQLFFCRRKGNFCFFYAYDIPREILR